MLCTRMLSHGFEYTSLMQDPDNDVYHKAVEMTKKVGCLVSIVLA